MSVVLYAGEGYVERLFYFCVKCGRLVRIYELCECEFTASSNSQDRNNRTEESKVDEVVTFQTAVVNFIKQVGKPSDLSEMDKGAVTAWKSI